MQKHQRPKEQARRREEVDDAHEPRDMRTYVSAHDENILAPLEALQTWGEIPKEDIVAAYTNLERSPEALRRVLQLTYNNSHANALGSVFTRFKHIPFSQLEKTMREAMRANVTGDDLQRYLEIYSAIATQVLPEQQHYGTFVSTFVVENQFVVAGMLPTIKRILHDGDSAQLQWIFYGMQPTRSNMYGKLYHALAERIFFLLDRDDQKCLVAGALSDPREDFTSVRDAYSDFFSDDELACLQTDRLIRTLGNTRDGYEDDGEVTELLDRILQGDVERLSITQLSYVLQSRPIVNRPLEYALFEEKGVKREVFDAAVYAAYQHSRMENVGHAIQFAWRYPELNIQKIPAALNAAGLVVGNWIPPEIFDYVARVVRAGEPLDDEVFFARRSHAVTPQEFQELRTYRPKALELVKGKVDAGMIMRELADTDTYVGDEHIRKGMRTVQDIVGADVALQYANRLGLSRHDAFHFADDIARYFRQSGMTAKEFGSVLLQVVKDDSQYTYGNAHTRFAEVMQSFSQSTTESVLAEARQLTNIEELQKLVREIDTGVRVSWKLLKKMYDVKQFLGRRELLEELNRDDLDSKLRAYVLKLAFHENIAMDRVMQFWKQPHEFLEIDDAHTSEEINASKKPSNYVSLPYLGMTAEDLRDALVQGSVDRVQTLPPMERTFVVAGNDVLTSEEAVRATNGEPVALHAALVSAIGMQRKGIPGKARDAKMLFGRVQGFLKECGVVWAKAWDAETGPETLAGMSDAQRSGLARIIDDAEFGIPTTVRGDEYRMILGNKSDPDMVIAGNDTASCMPFGSGKNNVYMYNPNCMQLVLQRKTSEGTWRTAAQSVVTIDVETGKPTPDLIHAYKQQGRLKDVVAIDRLAHPGTVTCDNIEIAKNEEGARSANISKLYTRFWKEYLATHAQELQVDATHVMVGTGYTPGALNLPSVVNTYIPLAPMGYSDNVHGNAFEITTGLPAGEFVPKSGIAPMTTRDVLAIALLEGKAYHDNVSLLENLHGMQNNVIGMEIANAHFDRPNLSFVFRDGKGLPKGYMLAYEGRNGSKQEVYISDLAADPESKLAGGKLIASFFDAYIANYGTGDRPFLPMFTNARDQTSYKIIQSQFKRFLDRAGLVGEIVELKSYYKVQDLFHDLRMFVGRTHEDIDKQKEEYAHRTPPPELDMSQVRGWDGL